ncbi:uncharacterized protein K02A2.6-like [Malaya genurostris]|uniref:uncharacterized protein K02A2.6-like n=1 Tax=Malaya genurostris TaxID=325434 RepID=UPI0026F40651|nr:uncharacterized protein K02A2.6-like [Malaya genurostris]
MPVMLVSDNDTQFTSVEFANFCALNGIEHVTTAPFYPQSNGQVERSTPNRTAPEGRSPSEVMFGRRIRTCLELLRPSSAILPMTPHVQQDQQRRSFNRNELVFAKVHHRNTWKWAPGVILEKIGDVMYNVLVDRRVLRSHINQLRCRTETVSPSTGSLSSASSSTKLLPLDVLLGAWDLPKL